MAPKQIKLVCFMFKKYVPLSASAFASAPKSTVMTLLPTPPALPFCPPFSPIPIPSSSSSPAILGSKICWDRVYCSISCRILKHRRSINCSLSPHFNYSTRILFGLIKHRNIDVYSMARGYSRAEKIKLSHKNNNKLANRK